MRKNEAAQFLGISIRTLELYTQQGRIGGRYEKGKTRPVLVYDEDEVKRLQAELAGQSYTHRPVVERSTPERSSVERQVVERPVIEVGATTRFDGASNFGARSQPSFGEQGHSQQGNNSGSNNSESNSSDQALVPIMPPQIEQFLSAMLALRAPQAPSGPAEVPIQHKLFLTLDEAQTFTGLSRGILREAIKANELPAKIIGRGWRIKRADLETYAQNMTMEASVEP